MRGKHWLSGDYGEWKKEDQRSKWNRHWDGKHTKQCAEYSTSNFGDICKESGEYLGTRTDLERLRKARNK